MAVPTLRQDMQREPLMQKREGKTAIVIITSDKGLAGALNSNVIRATEQEIQSQGLSKDDIVMFAIGRRGGDYFLNRGYIVREKHENVSDDISEVDMRMVTDTLLHMHKEGEIGSAILVYMNFLSTFEQKPVVRQLIPVTPETIKEMVAGIVPVKGKYAGVGQGESRPNSYTIEPSAEAIVKVLIPRLLNIAVYHGLLEGKASEHSARMVAMKSATDKAKEMTKMLTRKFNKIRQAAITREVSEITSGIEAMK